MPFRMYTLAHYDLYLLLATLLSLRYGRFGPCNRFLNVESVEVDGAGWRVGVVG